MKFVAHFSKMFLTTLLLALIGVGTTLAAEPLDQIVAVVNQEVITQSQLNDAISRVKQQMAQSGAPLPAEKVLRKNVLNQLVDRALQLQMAKRLNYKATDAQVNKAISQIAAQNHLSIEQLKQQVQKETGFSFAQFKNEIKNQMLINQVQQAIAGSDVAITPKEIKHLISQSQNPSSLYYHVIDFLIALPATPNHSDLKKANDQALLVLNDLKSNLDQQKITAKYPSLQVNDLDWRPLAALPDLFIKKLPTMKNGSAAGPFVAPNGIHVIQLIATRNETGSAQQTLTTQQAQQLLYQQKLQGALQKWLAKIRATSYIKIEG